MRGRQWRSLVYQLTLRAIAMRVARLLTPLPAQALARHSIPVAIELGVAAPVPGESAPRRTRSSGCKPSALSRCSWCRRRGDSEEEGDQRGAYFHG